MFQRVCDRCGEVLKEQVIQFGNKNSNRVEPETHFNIYGPEEPCDNREGHLCKDCTNRFIDWLCAGVLKDE